MDMCYLSIGHLDSMRKQSKMFLCFVVAIIQFALSLLQTLYAVLAWDWAGILITAPISSGLPSSNIQRGAGRASRYIFLMDDTM